MSEITFERKDGWVTRFVDGKPSYVRCSACDAPVDKVDQPHGWCEDCLDASQGPENG